MLNRIVNIISRVELRNRLVLTLVILAVYRLGFVMPLPYVNRQMLEESLTRRGDGAHFHLVTVTPSLIASNSGLVLVAAIMVTMWCVPTRLKVMRSSQHDV